MSSLSAKGVAIVNLLQLQPEETVSAVINISKTDNAANLIMCTVRGVVKKTPFSQYQNVRNSGLIAINLDEGDELKWIRMTSGDNEVVISTSNGQAIRFHEKDARPMGRVSRGVRGIRLRTDDHVIGMDIVEEGSSIFVISKYGYGKKTKVSQFTAHARGGVGIRSAVVNTKTGELVNVKTLGDNDDQEVIIISKSGQTIRLGIKDIPALGRATQGVRIMRLNDSDEVVSLALVDKSEEPDDEDEVVLEPTTSDSPKVKE
jgi:DNA gyrase subunit A